MKDIGNLVQVLLLDLLADFDTLDNGILKCRLINIGISGLVLYWLMSFIMNRTVSVKYVR